MANGLINKKLIMKAWTFLREKEMSIPDETLDFMRDAAIEKLERIEKVEELEKEFNEIYKKNLINEVTKEVRNYTNKKINFIVIPFPKNHLYCVRGIYCDFAEHHDYVDVYIKP
jgi:hypothetical protein